jgi:2-oxoglutarate ferredoxin oxidoreductase subunit alpha
MMENIGLAAMMEIPCVIVNIQRGSPSTGLPTLPGQADMMQARWGSHGDYSVVALSPWSPQEIFNLTYQAFNIADRFRVPVLLMADEVVGHMVERVVIPEQDRIPVWGRKRPNGKNKTTFKPFQVRDDDLVPPMVHAGDGYRIHFTGLTHDEDGYPDMSPETHQTLVTRLIDKIQVNRDEIIQTEESFMEDARIVVIAYGSTARSARRAVKEARNLGIPAGFLRLISVWPFPERKIQSLSESIDSFIVAEMNLGQIVNEVERVVHRPVRGVHHAGGIMMSPDPILGAIQEVANHGGS